jgi:Glycosyl transferases group 1
VVESFKPSKARGQGTGTPAEPKPRICMPTARNFTRRAYQCGQYEAQDVLREIDDVDLIHLEADPGFQFKESWQRRLLFRDLSKKLIYLNPGLRPVRLTREYDIFLVRCQTWWDLPYVNAIQGWKDCCKISVCWIDELWAAAIPLYKYWLDSLKQFDHIIVGCSGTVLSLSKALDRPCHWLPAGVDTLRFSPYPDPPARVIDVYSIGRRWEGIHRALLKAAQGRASFYVYDTFPSIAERQVYDYQQHRGLFANMAKRSRYFTVAPGKVDELGETQGQVEVGHRYYEGAAAGTVMIGQRPNSEVFKQLFDWPDAVIQTQPDGSDVLEVLADLDSEPARVSAISRRNAAEALLRHDWAYRWKEILHLAGIEPLPYLAARERRLKDLADRVTSCVPESVPAGPLV